VSVLISRSATYRDTYMFLTFYFLGECGLCERCLKYSSSLLAAPFSSRVLQGFLAN